MSDIYHISQICIIRNVLSEIIRLKDSFAKYSFANPSIEDRTKHFRTLKNAYGIQNFYLLCDLSIQNTYVAGM